MIELLFLTFIFLTFISYMIFEGDMLAPAFIVCAMYTFSVGCALINKTAWKLDDFSMMTFGVLVSGALVFIAINIFCRMIFAPKALNRQSIERIDIRKGVTDFIIIFDAIFLVAWVYNVYLISSHYGATGTLGVMMSVYRAQTSYSSEASMPGVLSQLLKIVTACAYIYLFAFINNAIIDSWKKYKEYLVPIILYLIVSLFSSNRLNMLYVVAAAVTYYFLLKKYQLGKPKRSLKLICRIIGAFLLILLVFYGVRLLVGRLTSEDAGLIEYITKYAGGSIKLLDLYFNNPVKSKIWGKETFPSLIGNLKGFGLMDFDDYIVHKEFRRVNGMNIGNIYTAYRSWYADFGMTGIITLNIGFASFYNIYYYVLMRKNNIAHRQLIIMYGYLVPALFLHSIDDYFYKYVFCMGFALYVIVFYVMIGFILGGHKIKFKIGRVSLNG